MQTRMIVRTEGRSAVDRTSGRIKEIVARKRVLLARTSAIANRKKSVMVSAATRVSELVITMTITKTIDNAGRICRVL
jgi:hypothetical protein